MNITDEQIREAAKQWGQEDPDEEKTDVTRVLADTARRSFIKGASWMQEQSKPEWVCLKDREPEIGQTIIIDYGNEKDLLFVDSIVLGTLNPGYKWIPLP
ncbi:hypothetical protein [Arcticibacter sp.]|uniref:hypothetical protein n=1 Tax=Arcticibacter sp. TaxID=1872630 RepID=UPI00388CF0D0